MDEQLNYFLSAGQQLDLSTLPTSKTGQDFLASVSNYVSTNKGQIVSLKKPSGVKLRIADVDDTIYRDDEDEVYAWGNFFLPDPVHMQVFAVVEDVSCLADHSEQIVLMTCENKKVYAYDDEGLHLVALSLKKLLKEGLRCPAYDNYYNGDAFIHMTEEDWAKEKQSPLGKKLDEEHHKLVESLQPRILEILRSTRKRRAEENARKERAEENTREQKAEEKSEKRKLTKMPEKRKLMKMPENKKLLIMLKNKKLMKTPEKRKLLKMLKNKKLMKTPEKRKLLKMLKNKKLMKTPEKRKLVKMPEKRKLMKMLENEKLMKISEKRKLMKMLENEKLMKMQEKRKLMTMLKKRKLMKPEKTCLLFTI